MEVVCGEVSQKDQMYEQRNNQYKNKFGKEKQFKINGKQTFPSAFYSMKKHLVNKKKPIVEDNSGKKIIDE